MKLKYLIIALCFLFSPASGQFLNKLKNKIEDKAVDKIINGNKDNDNTATDVEPGAGSENGSTSEGGKGRATNKGGGGLISTPPDVNQNLTEAETSYKSNSYGEARYAIQQAMLGVEMEIGHEILKSLPETISNLNKDESADQVTNTGWGWLGLTISRRYTDGADKELQLAVANNAVYMNAINMYLGNAGYSQTTGGEQNWKQTKIKGYRAVIEYDDASGYKLTVPIGQTSMVLFEGINMGTEKDMMAAAEAVDIDSIKTMLGEQ